MKEVRIWNYARSAEEIQSDKEDVYSSIPEGLIGYWRLNEGSGGTVADMASGHTGTLVGDPVWATEVVEDGGSVIARSFGQGYRFGYQGEFSEEDPETGWNHFELRDYDPVIGRWLTVDPARQFASGYVGMGNNPIMGIDPDGAYSKAGAWVRALFTRGVSASDIYQSGGEWGFNRPTGTFTSVDGTFNGESFTTQVPGYYSDFGTFGEDVARIQAYQPNFFGSIKNNLLNSEAHVKFTGLFIYNIIDDAYVSFGQMGRNRHHLDGSGVIPNQIQDSGINTLLSVNPMTSLNAGIPTKTLNAGQFNSLFKGTGLNSAKGVMVRSYNQVVKSYHKLAKDLVLPFNGKSLYDTANQTATE